MACARKARVQHSLAIQASILGPARHTSTINEERACLKASGPLQAAESILLLVAQVVIDITSKVLGPDFDADAPLLERNVEAIEEDGSSLACLRQPRNHLLMPQTIQ